MGLCYCSPLVGQRAKDPLQKGNVDFRALEMCTKMAVKQMMLSVGIPMAEEAHEEVAMKEGERIVTLQKKKMFFLTDLPTDNQEEPAPSLVVRQKQNSPQNGGNPESTREASIETGRTLAGFWHRCQLLQNG